MPMCLNYEKTKQKETASTIITTASILKILIIAYDQKVDSSNINLSLSS